MENSTLYAFIHHIKLDIRGKLCVCMLNDIIPFNYKSSRTIRRTTHSHNNDKENLLHSFTYPYRERKNHTHHFHIF